MTTPNYRSESTEAAAIASDLRKAGFTRVFKRDLIDYAETLGFKPHSKPVTEHGEERTRDAFTSYQARAIYQRFVAEHTHTDSTELFPAADRLAVLASLTDAELLDELSRRLARKHIVTITGDDITRIAIGAAKEAIKNYDK